MTCSLCDDDNHARSDCPVLAQAGRRSLADAKPSAVPPVCKLCGKLPSFHFRYPGDCRMDPENL